MVRRSMQTSIKGKVNNFGDFKTQAYLPVFEALINSIHSIEELHENINNGIIDIKIIRDLTQKEITDEGINTREEKDIIGFEIVDNGVGFNDANYESFCTSETTYKLKKGGKGLGRFSWLKAFDEAIIESIYTDKDKTKKLRKFKFSISGEIDDSPIEDAGNSPNRTIVKLNGFHPEYRDLPSAYKTTSKIAQRVLSHCISYYLGGKVPEINIIDGDDSNPLPLKNLYKDMIIGLKSDEITISKHKFKITHVKSRFSYNDINSIVLCAENRDVEPYSIKNYISAPSLVDNTGLKFYYSAYVFSNYLDEHVNDARTSFNLPQIQDLETSLDADKIPIDTIKSKVMDKTKEYLKEYFDLLKIKKHEKADRFIQKNQTLRAVVKHCPEIYDEIDVNASDDKVNELFYKFKGINEYRIKKHMEKALKSKTKNVAEVIKECDVQINEVMDFQKDNLAWYVLYREKIIELLEKNITVDTDGVYKYEKIIHDIVFPKGTDSDELLLDYLNLWLIDEILSYHEFAKSDKQLRSFSTSNSQNRPDIFLCCECGNDNVARSIGIIEFKRPGDDDFDDNPIDQIYKTIRELESDTKIFVDKKNMKNKSITVNKYTKYYCYAICEINERMKLNHIYQHKYQELMDNLGYFTYNDHYNANIWILAYNQLLPNVKKRHQVFFDKLGITPP